MGIDIILTPFKRIIIFIFLIAYLILLTGFLLRSLSEDPYFKHNDVVADDSDRGPFLTDDSRHLHVFVQVSDLHLSIYYDRKRGPQFKDFCSETIQVIKPEVVLITGDLTDAKYPDRQGSIQYEAEWKEYYKIIKETKVENKTVWLDLRGNHDVFDVPSDDSKQNYFRRYSVQGKSHKKSYHYKHRTSDGDIISFIGFDACPCPGPRRPFNFFGVITSHDLSEAERLYKESSPSNITIWFGHYPTSVITGDVDKLRTILSKGSVYLSGHLHTLGGLASVMYARQHAGYLELEVGDWMDNRIYRVFAVDHGLFSFTDEHYKTWPVILITNPKHGQFLIPHKEPVNRIRSSTHIRIVAFSTAAISNVTVTVDGTFLGTADHSDGSLYTLPWNASQYNNGLHIITVQVQDSDGRERVISQPFTLDQTRIPFDYWPRFILMSQHQSEGKILFAMAFIGTILPMILSTIFNFSVDVNTSDHTCSSLLWFCQLMIRRYKILVTTPSVFWPLLAFHIYVAVGPWFIGEVLKGYIGMVFVYGIFVKNTFIPGSLTYLYGFFQFLLFNFPLTQYLAYVLDQCICRHKHPVTFRRNYKKIISWVFHHGIFIMMLVLQVYLSYIGIYLPYGLVAVLLSPVKTWSVVLALALQFTAQKKNIPSYRVLQQNEMVETEL